MVNPQRINNKPCEDFIKAETEAFFKHSNITLKTDIRKVCSDLYDVIYDKIEQHNAQIEDKQEKWPIPSDLHPEQVATVIALSGRIKRVAPYGLDVNPDNDRLCWYNNGDQNNEDDKYKGTYFHFSTSLNRYISNITWHNNITDIISYLFDILPRTPVCDNPDLIPVNNGVFDYKNKKLLPFTDRVVFLTKIPVDYVPDAVCPVIEHESGAWDIENWFKNIDDTNDEDLSERIWRIIGASIRPNVDWKKCVVLYSTKSFADYYTLDGKWTVSMLINNLCGVSALDVSYENFINRIQWGDNFAMANVIISDNDRYGHDNLDDKETNNVFKQIVANDIIHLPKRTRGKKCELRIKPLLLCVFYMKPKITDEDKKFFKKQINIGFHKIYDKNFLQTVQREFISRQDVLEYVLKRVLTMPDYYEL